MIACFPIYNRINVKKEGNFMLKSILSKKVEVRETSLSGKGTFAIENIKKAKQSPKIMVC